MKYVGTNKFTCIWNNHIIQTWLSRHQTKFPNVTCWKHIFSFKRTCWKKFLSISRESILIKVEKMPCSLFHFHVLLFSAITWVQAPIVGTQHFDDALTTVWLFIFYQPFFSILFFIFYGYLFCHFPLFSHRYYI